MSDRDEIAKTIYNLDPDLQAWNGDRYEFREREGYRKRKAVAAADAIIARFPYMSADQSLYDYAASLRQQLLDTRAELDQLRGHA